LRTFEQITNYASAIWNINSFFKIVYFSSYLNGYGSLISTDKPKYIFKTAFLFILMNNLFEVQLPVQPVEIHM